MTLPVGVYQRSGVWYVSHYEGNGIHKQLGKFIEGMAVNSFGDVLQKAA